jgi:hypothetical protein
MLSTDDGDDPMPMPEVPAGDPPPTAAAKGASRLLDVAAGVDSHPSSRGGAQMPPADDVLIAAIELALTGAGLPKAAEVRDKHAVGTGFSVVPVAGAAYPRAAVTWYEADEPVADPAGTAGRLRDCEQALRRAGFHVEYTAADTGDHLLAWQRGRATAYFSRVELRRR